MLMPPVQSEVYPSSLRGLIESKAVADELFRYIHGLLRSFESKGRGHRWIEEEAMDSLQEVCLRALVKESTYRPGEGGVGWLKKVAFRVVWNRCVRRRRRRELGGLFEQIADLIPAPSVKDEGWVWEFVEQLPTPGRDVLRLRFGAGMDSSFIASRLGLSSVQAVYGLQNRAVNNLRKLIEAARL